MTHKTLSKRFNHMYPAGESSNAHFRNIDADITAFGELLDTVNPAILTRTSDTGQYTPGSYVSGRSDNAIIGYYMYRFSDGHGDIFVRFDFSVATAGFINATVGTATDGSGGFSGWSHSIPYMFGFSNSSYFGGYPQYISASVKEGFIGIRLGHNWNNQRQLGVMSEVNVALNNNPFDCAFFARPVDVNGDYVSGEMAIISGGSTFSHSDEDSGICYPGYVTLNLNVSQVYNSLYIPGLSNNATRSWGHVGSLFAFPMMNVPVERNDRWIKVLLPFAQVREIPDLISCYHQTGLQSSFTLPDGRTYKSTGGFFDPITRASLAMRIS